MRVVAVTRAGNSTGQALLEALSHHPRIKQLLAIDVTPLPRPLPRVEFFQLDLRHPLLHSVLDAHGVDTVIHLNLLQDAFPSYQPPDFDRDVNGTMKLMAACVYAGVKDIVITSPAGVYGARADGAVYLREQSLLAASGSGSCLQEGLEVEKYAAEYAGRYPDKHLVMVRTAPVPGTTMDPCLTPLLGVPLSVTVAGYDPLLQFLHRDDLVQTLWHIFHKNARGIFHVGPSGVIPLAKALRWAGVKTFPLPGPAARATVEVMWSLGLYPIPAASLEFLRHSCLLSTRETVRRLGFQPQHTSEETLRQYLATRRNSPAFSESSYELTR